MHSEGASPFLLVESRSFDAFRSSTHSGNSRISGGRSSGGRSSNNDSMSNHGIGIPAHDWSLVVLAAGRAAKMCLPHARRPAGAFKRTARLVIM
jgi:hypothetical protein